MSTGEKSDFSQKIGFLVYTERGHNLDFFLMLKTEV